MNNMFCPKCGGGTYILEEDLVRILENTKPLKAVIKIIYVCRACSEKFGRLIHEDLERKRRDETGTAVNTTQQPTYQTNTTTSSDEPTEGVRFF